MPILTPAVCASGPSHATPLCVAPVMRSVPSTLRAVIESDLLCDEKKLDMLQFCVDLGDTPSARTLGAAAQLRSAKGFEIMQWLLQVSCPLDAKICSEAAAVCQRSISQRTAKQCGFPPELLPKRAVDKVELPLVRPA